MTFNALTKKFVIDYFSVLVDMVSLGPNAEAGAATPAIRARVMTAAAMDFDMIKLLVGWGLKRVEFCLFCGVFFIRRLLVSVLQAGFEMS